MRTLAIVALAFILGSGDALAQEPQDFTVNVVRENAEAVIFVNGVPIHRVVWKPEDVGTPVTDAVSTGLWLADGDNTLAVEAHALAAGGYAEVTILQSLDQPYLLEQRIEGDGRAELTVNVEGQPRWAWLDSEAYSGDATELLAAVAALHDAIARQDMDAYMAAHQARNDDFTIVWGPMPPEMAAQLGQALAAMTLAPLSASLTATPYLDGRVWVVHDEAGRPPVQIADTEGSSMDTGEFWTRRDGVWQVVR